MLRPSATQLLSKGESYYSLVTAVAKRARQIADELYENNMILEEKPVKAAVEEFASGKCKFIESPELSKNRED